MPNLTIQFYWGKTKIQHKRLILLLFLLSCFCLLGTIIVIIQPIKPLNKQISDFPCIVGTSTTLFAVGSPYCNKGFYANTRYWCFWSTGIGSKPDGWYYSSSTDNVTWTKQTYIRNGWYRGDFVFDGTYMHYSYVYANEYLYYRIGIPQSDGVINWLVTEQNIVLTGTNYRASLAVDSSGYPWIAYVHDNGAGQQTPYITSSSTKNGVWTTKSGYPQILDSTTFGAEVICNIVSLTNNKIYVTWHNNWENGPALPIYGRLYNSTTWLPREAVSSTYGRDSTFSLTSTGDDVHMSYLKYDITFDIVYRKRTYSIGSWESEEIIKSGLTTPSNPDLTGDTETGDIYVLWSEKPNFYYKRRFSNGTWDTVQNPITDSTITGDGHLIGWIHTYNNFLAMIYTSDAPSPYNIRYLVCDINKQPIPPIIEYIRKDIRIIVSYGDYNRTLYLDPNQWYCKYAVVYGGNNPFPWDLAYSHAPIAFFMFEDIANQSLADNYGDIIIRMNPVNGTIETPSLGLRMCFVTFCEGSYDKYIYYKDTLLFYYHWNGTGNTIVYDIKLITLPKSLNQKYQINHKEDLL